MQPLIREKVHFIIAKEIEKYIENNSLKKGDPLPSEKQFAEELQVSRSSVREGLRLLEGMGMVEARHGKGVFVNNTRATTIILEVPTDRQSYLDVLEIRETLENKACMLAMENATPEDLDNLKATYIAMTESYEKGENAHKQDIDFHIAIYQATNNSFLKSLLESVIYIFFNAWPTPYGMEDAFHDTYPYHKIIYKAILEKDKQAAADAVKEIIMRGNRSVTEIINTGEKNSLKFIDSKLL